MRSCVDTHGNVRNAVSSTANGMGSTMISGDSSSPLGPHSKHLRGSLACSSPILYSRMFLLCARSIVNNHCAVNGTPIIYCMSLGDQNCRSPWKSEFDKFAFFSVKPPYSFSQLVGPFCQHCNSFFCCHKPVVVSNGSSLAYHYSDVQVSENMKPSNKSVAKPENPSFKFLSFNICSFFDHSKTGRTTKWARCTRPSRIPGWKAQLLSDKILVAGFQEARLRDRKSECNHFLVYSSQMQSQYLGVAIFLNKHDPVYYYNDGVKCKCLHDRSMVCRCYAQPRALIISVSYPFGVVFYVAIHAPDSKWGEAELSKWWELLFTNIRKYIRPGAVVVSFIDGNCKVGSVMSQHVGDNHAEQENLCGSYLHKYLRITQSFLASTFRSCSASCSPYTYKASNDSTHRIDFLALPLKWKENSCVAWNSSEPELLDRSMHAAVLCKVTGTAEPTMYYDWKNQCDYDVGAMRVCECEHVKKSIAQQMQLCDNSLPFLDATSAMHHVERHCHFVATTHFPKGTRPSTPNKPYLSQDTFRHVVFKNQCIRDFRQFKYRVLKPLKRIFFNAWLSGYKARTPPSRVSMLWCFWGVPWWKLQFDAWHIAWYSGFVRSLCHAERSSLAYKLSEAACEVFEKHDMRRFYALSKSLARVNKPEFGSNRTQRPVCCF